MSSSSSTDKIKLRILVGGTWQQNNQEWEYYTDQPMIRVMVPSNTTHSTLLSYVQSKSGIDFPLAMTRIAYKHRSQLYELRHTPDVLCFLQAAAAVRNVPTLYVYVDMTTFGSSNVGGNLNTICQPHSPEQSHTSSYIPQFGSENDNVYGVNSDFIPEENYVFGNPEFVPETEEPRPEEDDEEDDDESCVYRLDLSGIDSNEEETDEEETRETSPPRSTSGINDLFGQPPPLPEDREIVLTPNEEPVSYDRSDRVNTGDIFQTKDALLVALGRKFLEEGFEFEVDRSSRTRYEATCKADNCDWRIYATCLKDTNMFQVRKLHDVHICSRTQMHPSHRNANRRVLGNIIFPKVMDESRKLRGSDIVKDVKEQLNIDISYKQAWRAKAYALTLVRGCPHESFTRLPAYFHNLELHNPGTVTRIKTDNTGRFQLCFAALGCAVRKISF